MIVYRLCDQNEVNNIFENMDVFAAGHKFQKDNTKNTHMYIQEKKYMHFFEQIIHLLYLNYSKGKIICIYSIPDEILKLSSGKGFYLDFINFENIQEITEYAIESNKIKFNYLQKIYIIKEDLDFDYVPSEQEIYNHLYLIYDFKKNKSKIEKILTGNNVAESICKNIELFLTLMPEIKYMFGFEHNHPHHHLDVWQHTLEVLNNLYVNDLELNMAALLHDVGKPFSYQDKEVRNFHGHCEISCEITKKILTRLGYNKEFIQNVTYLVKTHDTIIEPNNLDNNYEMVRKRLKLQYADAKAHHPDKIQKRIKILNNINDEFNLIKDKYKNI